MTKQFDLEAFKAFVESKPRDERYDFWSRDCAFAQFTRQRFGTEWTETHFADHVELCTPLQDRPWTFGALLDRLNNLTAATSPNAAEGGDSPLVPALTYLNGDEE